MQDFGEIALLNSISAATVALLGIAAILIIFSLYFKFLRDLNRDVKDAIEKIASKKLKEEAGVDRKKLNDEIIKKFMK